MPRSMHVANDFARPGEPTPSGPGWTPTLDVERQPQISAPPPTDANPRRCTGAGQASRARAAGLSPVERAVGAERHNRNSAGPRASSPAAPSAQVTAASPDPPAAVFVTVPVIRTNVCPVTETTVVTWIVDVPAEDDVTATLQWGDAAVYVQVFDPMNEPALPAVREAVAV